VNIHFNHIIPEPLRELLGKQPTEIWNQKLTLKSGQKLIIEAPSGKGKSTFLNIIFGIRTDFTGDMMFDQNSVSNNSNFNWDLARKSKISMVHQGLELFDELSAWQNVVLKNNITQFKPEADIHQLFEVLEISSLQDKKAKKLSFGQRQRVAIIRALCQPYSWLLLDEPFSHLDYETASKALDLIIKESEAQSAGVLLTSLNELKSDLFTKKLIL